jgi:hypothetical protein
MQVYLFLILTVILVGGSTRMPRIADEVEKFFGKRLKELILMRLLQLEQLFKVEFFLEM